MPTESMWTLGEGFESVRNIKFLMNHGTPSERNIFKLLEPREFDMPTLSSPLRTINMLHRASWI